MKAFKFNLTLLLTAIVALFSPPNSTSNTADSLVYENDSVFTIESYKDELSSDGEWIKVDKDQVDPDGVTGAEADYDDDINYEYIWRPYGVGPDWSPYTNGHWVYTNCGWMWISYYHWGWRTCHYGRWWWSPSWGWVWSPGFVWAPAWVVWMFYGDYWGWYPISPRISWHRHHGWRGHHMRFHVRRWTFCHTNNYTSPITITVIVDPPGNKEIIDKATFVSDINVVNDKVVNKGPDVGSVEKLTQKKISTRDVTKYNNAKVITGKERVANEKKFESEKGYIEKQTVNEKKNYKEKQSGNEKEIYRQENYEKKQRNDEATKNNEKGYDNEKEMNKEKKSSENSKKERNYEQPKNYDQPEKSQKSEQPKKYNSPEKKENYEKPKDNNSDAKNEPYESSKEGRDENSNKHEKRMITR